MGNRPSLASQRASLSAETYIRCREQREIPEAVARLLMIGVIIDELQQIVDMSMGNMERYGEITDGTDKAIRLRVRDLYRNVLGGMDMPILSADTLEAAD